MNIIFSLPLPNWKISIRDTPNQEYNQFINSLQNPDSKDFQILMNLSGCSKYFHQHYINEHFRRISISIGSGNERCFQKVKCLPYLNPRSCLLEQLGNNRILGVL